ncbi:MAG: TIGR01906 family membrane protein [Anaerolineae bacterium]|nr:TIGR01906 family membrane protein [Anaerolineae bacterium]
MNSPTEQPRDLPNWLITMLRGFLVLSLPAFLVLTSVRLVMSEVFLQVEYRRPGFPADRFGFTQADRLRYAPYAVRYLLNSADISYLGDLELDGKPLYTQKELDHMADVKVVTRIAFRAHALLCIGLGITLIALGWQSDARRALRQGLFEGGVFCACLIVTLVVLFLANWDFFFTGFHRVFFEGDSWRFSYSSTLIRLFPEQFWFDAALTIGALTVAGTLAAILGARWWERRAQRTSEASSP